MSLREPTQQEVFDQLNSGRNWGSSVITYSFPVTAAGLYTGNGEGEGFTSMLASGQAAARLAISLWDDLIVADFQETSPGSNFNFSNLEFGMSTTGIGYAHAYYPNTGSIWFNAVYSSGNYNLVSPNIGQNGFRTVIHEIGHALGLDHAGMYNGTGKWAPLNLHDSTVFSVMSYFGPDRESGEGQVAWADWRGADGVLYAPQTPMLNDIYVIQRIYGAETTTRIENTTYGFNSNITGNFEKIYDFTRNSNPILTIYDSAGIDTLDLSGWSTSSIIDIGQGRFSSCNSMTNNIAIAFGCDIENARGGSGADKIYGNALNNILYGGAGNDELFGLGGNDTIYGGLGSDTAVFTLTRTSYQITSFQNYLTLQSSSGTIALYEIEYLRFSDGTVSASSLSQSSDTTAPTVSTFMPLDGATGVALASNIVLTFSETIARGAGTITLRSGSATGNIVENFDAATSSRLIISGAALTIDPTSNLLAGTQYFVTFSSGAIKDIAGNAYTGTTAYDFMTVSDTTAPNVSLFSPSDGATGVALASNIVLTFSETIARGAGTITLRSGSATGNIVENFDAATSSRLIISGAALTIDPTNNLLAGTQYFVTFSSGAIKDIAGNAYTGSMTYDFTTAAALVADDYPNATNTTGLVTVGSPVSRGIIETEGDHDLFKVTLTAGSTYIFALTATSGSLDPYLYLYDANAAVMASNNNYGSSHNSQITFTANATGTYYLQAMDLYRTGTGSYTLGAIKPDITAPTVSTFSPSDGAMGIAVASNIILTFSEDIARGAGTITLRSGSATGPIVENFNVATSNRLAIIGPTISIDPTSNLLSGIQYFVTVSSGAIKDLAGNAYVGTTSYDFTAAAAVVADDYPETVAGLGVVTIGAAATTGSIETAEDVDGFRVSLTAGVTYTFNLNVTSGSLDPYLALYDSLEDDVDAVAINDDYGSSLNSQITFTATRSGTYYLAVEDYSQTGTGNYSLSGQIATPDVDDYPESLAGLGVVTIGAAATTGSIETAEDQDGFRVSLTAGVTYTFNLNVTSGSLNPYLAVFGIIEGGDESDEDAFYYIAENDDYGSSLNSQITFTATRSGTYYLNVGEDYDIGTGNYSLSGQIATPDVDDYPESLAGLGVVTIGAAATTGSIETAEDVDGFRVSLTAGVTYTFNLNVTSGSLDPYLALYDSLEDDVDAVAINDDYGSSLNSQITFTATRSGTYYLAVEDYSQTGTGNYTLRGTAQAADTTAPTVATFAPADGATNVTASSNIVLTFSEAIARGTGTITIRTGSASGTIVESLDAATSNRLSISGSTIIIDPANNLAAGTQYFVLLPSGAIRDTAGNAYAGTSTYDFTTAPPADTTAPTVVTFAPADGATNVTASSNIVLTFSEAIARGTGTITVRSGSATGAIAENFNVATSSRVAISGSTLTIDPTNNLSSNTQYFVVFTPGTVKDAAGNANAGVSTYDFTTAALGAARPLNASDITNPSTQFYWDPAQGGNGHIYEFVSSSTVRWDEALALAKSRTISAVSGYLVTITSPQEQNAVVDFVYSRIPSTTFFIGASDAAIEDRWVWVSGPEAGTALSYVNWGIGEPNDSNNEDYAAVAGWLGGKWNDFPVSALSYYVIEYSDLVRVLAAAVTGTSGDDRLVSRSADETINGLGGLDTLVYSGPRLDYEISRANGNVTVRDLRPQGNGTDTLTNVERLEFADGLMGLIPEELVLFLPGSRDLITWDSTQGSAGFTYFFRLGASSTVAAVADFTGDGRTDVLLGQPGGGLIRWDTTLGGNGFAVLPAAPGFEVIGKGDLVGNSATDLLLKNAAGQLRILDPVAGTITDLFGLASGWSVAGVGNINGTGKADVVLQNNGTGAVIALTDQGWRDLITLGSGWEIAGLGDVTGGLADDFILQKADGVTIFWDATQGGNGWKDFATIGPAWDFAGFNDLNGDGRDDVVLQNDNGLAIYWTGSNWVDLGSTLIGTEMVGTGVFP